MSLEIKPAFENYHPNTLSAIASEKRLEELEIINKQITAELLQKSKERKIASDKKKRQLKENIGVGIMFFIILFIFLGVIQFFKEADTSTVFLLIFGVVIAVVVYNIVKKEFFS